MVNSNVLVLNPAYYPVNVCTARRAITLLYQGLAKAVDSTYQTYNFNSWLELSQAANSDDFISSVKWKIKIPRVIMLTFLDKTPRSKVRFSRWNIFSRDQNTCQYCGEKFSRDKLSLDHVVPKSRCGLTIWTNIVCACYDCNLKKENKTPEEAKMHLIRKPFEPNWSNFMLMNKGRIYKEWQPFLSGIDMSYWNAILDKE
ncbi:MAG: HNH endonuclease [Candidatus Paceibacterota bacterium]|jgi:5-methylcytosine-specific restriction endonuclease McrA